MKQIKYIFAGLLVVLGLTACTSVKMTSWSDPAFENRPIGKIMVLGIPESGSASSRYEGFFVDKLKEQGVDGTSCHSLLQPTDEITEEQLVQYLQENQYDSILVTRLIDQQEHTQILSTGSSYPSHYRDYYGYYSYGMAQTYIENVTEYTLETNLYDVKSRKLVWTAQKSITDLQSEESNIKDVVSVVIKDLEKKGLL